MPEIYAKTQESLKNITHFCYTLEEFTSQYIMRPNITEIVRVNCDYAVIEETEDLVKVHLITYDEMHALEQNLKSLLHWSITKRAKKLFFYTTVPAIAEVCMNLYFEPLQGHLTVINTSDEAINVQELFSNADITMGDKM